MALAAGVCGAASTASLWWGLNGDAQQERVLFCAVGAPEIVPDLGFEAYRTFVSSRSGTAILESLAMSTDLISERIKASVTALASVLFTHSVLRSDVAFQNDRSIVE
jgi:hypothetical protein